MAVVTEVELPVGDAICVPGYVSLEAEPSHVTGHRRLVVLAKRTLAATVISCNWMEIWVRVNMNPAPVVLGAVYRQWADPTEADSLTAFHERCATIVGSNTRVIVMGDINLDALRTEDPTYSRRAMAKAHFLAMQESGLEFAGPLTPTYTSHGFFKKGKTVDKRKSALDHVYVAGLAPLISVIDYAATDHRPVVATWTAVPPRVTAQTRVRLEMRRPISRVDSGALCKWLDASAKLSAVYELSDVDEILDSINSSINEALDHLAPLRPVPVRRSNNPLYLASDTLAAMKERDRAAMHAPSKYRALRNKASRLVRRDKLVSSLKTIGKSRNNQRKLWSHARSILESGDTVAMGSSLVVNGAEITAPAEVATAFNDFFISKICKIRESIPTARKNVAPNGEKDSKCTPPRFAFKFPSAGKIEAIIHGLRPTSAIGIDGIPVAILKKAAPAIAGPIAHLIRASFLAAKVPHSFKKALVHPIHKGKNKPSKSASSFRPISILPAISKVLERCVKEVLSAHLEPLLPPTQFGFRAGRNTTAAIGTAHGYWSKARAKDMIVGVAAFDLSAAFDTLDSEKLCDKLQALNIRGKENAWFRNYLSGRSQQVLVNGTPSSSIDVVYGVPQGSVLGPVLFLALIADMPSALGLQDVSEASGFVGYADDLVVWCAAPSLETARSGLALVSDHVCTYTANNYLSLSAEKTQVMWSGTNQAPCLQVGPALIEPSNTIDVLGTTFDKQLKPAPFVMAQTEAAMKISGLLRRLARCLTPLHLAQIASSLVLGKLGYAAAAALMPRMAPSDTQQVTYKKLQTLVNSMARVITGRTRSDRDNCETLLAVTGLPSLNRLIVKGVALETWRALKDTSPNPLASLILSGRPASRLTRAFVAGTIPPPTRFPTTTLAWYGHIVWNSYPELREAKTLRMAKKVAGHISLQCPL